jgi:hypothetical protein
MRNIIVALATIAALGLPVAATAAPAAFDGKLPMYPNGTLDPREASITPAALAQGVPVVELTSDSVATVDRWYAAHTKSCTRQAASGGFKYACAGGSIMIYNHSGTQIAFVPPFPKF